MQRGTTRVVAGAAGLTLSARLIEYMYNNNCDWTVPAAVLVAIPTSLALIYSGFKAAGEESSYENQE